jgi:parallel beta-helix repeat protein
VITKSLSLVGESGAIVDATGLGVGILVDGLSAPGLSDVVITGLTIENANFEGVLLANASAVTVSSNQVINNNKALAAGTCPGLPAYETNEQDDCGEGIHLLGADHAIISNNVVEGNAGGILLADDTGATHDNLISGNTVRDNPYDCGITLASHPPATLTGSASALGVYHNTVLGNRSARNGLASGGGAGIGMFASVPGAKTYGNVVVNNLVNENGLPGIAMHAHVPGQDLSNNVIAGNTIVNNGPDSADAATPGPTGINVYGAGDVTGTIISGNSIQSESVGIAIHTTARVQAHLNSLLGLETGLANLGSGPVGATVNWWGCDAGPDTQGCSKVQGSGVDFAPWLTTPIPAQSSY